MARHPEAHTAKNSDDQEVCGDWRRDVTCTCSLSLNHVGDHAAHPSHDLNRPVVMTWFNPVGPEEVEEAIKSILEVRRE